MNVEVEGQKEPEAATTPARKANCFDAIRLFAALTVVVWHSVRHLGLPLLWIEPGTGAWFFDGVPLFFVMSGMLVYRSCYKCLDTAQPIRNFYINRFLRVGPALYVYATLTPVFLLAIGAIGLGLVLSLPFAEWYLSNLAFCPVRESIFSHFTTAGLNGSLWTIPVEVSFYVVCPLLVLAERRAGLKGLLSALVAISVVGLIIKGRYEGNTAVPQLWWREGFESVGAIYKVANFTFLPYFVFFAFGIFWLRMWKKAPQSGWIAAASLALYIVIRWEMLPLHVGGTLMDLVWGVPFSYLAVWVGYNAPAWVGKLTKFGDISYGIYIWHMIVVNSVIYFAIPKNLGGPPILIHGVVLAFSFAVSYASWKLVEKPCLKLKPFTARAAETKAW